MIDWTSKKIHLKLSSAKCHPFCSSFNALTILQSCKDGSAGDCDHAVAVGLGWLWTNWLSSS